MDEELRALLLAMTTSPALQLQRIAAHLLGITSQADDAAAVLCISI